MIEEVVMEKVISTYRRWYRNEGHIQDQRFFKKCDVKDSMAINLTCDDVKDFITTVKKYCNDAIKGGNYERL